MRKLFSETEIGAFEQKFFSAELVDLRNCLDDNIALVKKISEDWAYWHRPGPEEICRPS